MAGTISRNGSLTRSRQGCKEGIEPVRIRPKAIRDYNQVGAGAGLTWRLWHLQYNRLVGKNYPGCIR
jgi:hypothetical protein